MAKQIQLTVAEPCHEQWDKMTPAEQGRFCAACQKQVVDFTTMTDSQLATFFKKPTTGSVCGRFMAEQLEKDITIPARRMPWVKYFFQLAIPAFLFSCRSVAQSKLPPVQGEVAVQTNKGETRGKVAVLPVEKERIIEGYVRDEDADPVADVSITIKGTLVSVKTDKQGYFKIRYKGVADNAEIVAEGKGVETATQLAKWKNNSIAKRFLEFILVPKKEPEEIVVIAGLIAVSRK